jgi:hypothetical protein
MRTLLKVTCISASVRRISAMEFTRLVARTDRCIESWVFCQCRLDTPFDIGRIGTKKVNDLISA